MVAPIGAELRTLDVIIDDLMRLSCDGKLSDILKRSSNSEEMSPGNVPSRRQYSPHFLKRLRIRFDPPPTENEIHAGDNENDSVAQKIG